MSPRRRQALVQMAIFCLSFITKPVYVSPFVRTTPLVPVSGICRCRHQQPVVAERRSQVSRQQWSMTMLFSSQSTPKPLDGDDNEKEGKEVETPKEQNPKKKVHTVTICMVPPPEHKDVWDRIGEMRRELKDPGYYRWPPHANLLYPFLQLGREDDDEYHSDLKETVERLRTATRLCPPFLVTLGAFGTFGGKNRGVLWLQPDSSIITSDAEDGVEESEDQDEGEVPLPSSSPPPPLVTLQRRLEEAFPTCNDQSSKGSGKNFTPHMTLSHFETLSDAKSAQHQLLEGNFTITEGGTNNDGRSAGLLPPMTFLLDRVYLLRRLGDDGQFERVAEIFLGDRDRQEDEEEEEYRIFHPASPFPAMPSREEDWVYEGRMAMKARRNRGSGGRRRGAGRYSGKRRGRGRLARPKDSPEVIAAKRKERKAKRDRERVRRVESEGEGEEMG